MFSIFNSCVLAESPRMWQWSFQTPASSQMEGIYDLYLDIMTVLVAVAVFVGYLMYVTLLWWYFEEFDHPDFVLTKNYLTAFQERLSQLRPVVYYSHKASVEFIWTLIPCVLLLLIAIPSFTLVLALDEDFRP